MRHIIAFAVEDSCSALSSRERSQYKTASFESFGLACSQLKESAIDKRAEFRMRTSLDQADLEALGRILSVRVRVLPFLSYSRVYQIRLLLARTPSVGIYVTKLKHSWSSQRLLPLRKSKLIHFSHIYAPIYLFQTRCLRYAECCL